MMMKYMAEIRVMMKSAVYCLSFILNDVENTIRTVRSDETR